ncbi:MAG: aminodeoxychorismate synthase component I [Desulfobacteraceae bacterium]|nr:MAG: aminodeoxychorismate synthase component I [Desulfobacteraceae bacterium]
MTQPSEFYLNLLKQSCGGVEGVSITPFSLDEPFLELASRFSEEPGTVVLMSGGDLDCAKFHILAIRPWLCVKAAGRQVTLNACGQTFCLECDPLDLLQQLMRHYQIAFDDPRIPVCAGLFGYLSYDLKDLVEDLPRTSIDDSGLPHLCFYAPSAIILHDKTTGRTWVCSGNRKDESGPTAGFDMEILRPAVSSGSARPDGFSGGSTGLRSSFTQSAYMEAVQKIKDYIVSGDIYQVNLSQRFETDFSGNPFSMFKSLYQTAPGPFYAYVNAGDHQIISTSPERFLKRSGNYVETRPIKGTRPRGKTPAEDRAFSDDLLQSRKDDAELSMIVDLMRNDLGRVCRGGSVRVAQHRRLEAYHNVFHLVSVVEGELMPDKDSVDLLRAAFPGGSITGCPRIRAMEIIDELEPVRRHVYTGSIGYVSFHDTMDLSIAIRTATIHQNRMVFSVGGGVVYDSDPADEYTETLHKGKTLMGVLQTEKKPCEADEWVWQNGRLVLKNEAVLPLGGLGVQYGYGFFETIRVENGCPQFLDDHIRRFDSAWKALLQPPCPDLTWSHVIHQVIDRNNLQNEIAAVKLMAFHGDRTEPPFYHQLAVSARKYTPRPGIIRNSGLELATYPHPRQTPLADHKTLNYLYYYLAGKWAADNGADEALILNPDGSVSETNTANILLIQGNTVIRPESRHVLSGVMEKQVVRCLEKNGYAVHTRRVMPTELLSADMVLVTNSLMGVVPMLGLGGKKLSVCVDFCKKINEAVLKEL